MRSMAKRSPIINQQTKKSEDSALADPLVALRLVRLLFRTGLAIVEDVLKQFPLSVAGPTSDRPDVQQRGQHGQGGERHAAQPVYYETDSFQVGFKQRLPPNQHAGR